MVDTVVLSLSKSMFLITDPDRFEPSARYILDNATSLGGRGYVSAKQNPTSSELKRGLYKPRLTLTNRYNHTGIREPSLKIELSLPKLLFGNNFDELTENDFEAIIVLLRKQLMDMGVMIFSRVLENAPVSSIHYSKNIPLIDGTTPNYLISRVKQANISLALDVNQTDYRNEGHSYKWHSNSYEIAFYDKLKDLEAANKSEKRAIESDNAIQLNLFDGFKQRRRFEVMRMEVRLNKRQKIMQLLRTLGIDSDINLISLFKTKIAQQILLHYIDEIENKRFPLYDSKSESPSSLLADIIICNPDIGVLKTFQLFGLKQAFDHITTRELRNMFGNYGQRSWYRLMVEAKSVKLSSISNPLEPIREQLLRFEPLKIVDFQEIKINNDNNR